MLPVDLLVSAYASGWFPMAVGDGDIRWFSPDPRGIIPLETFHFSRRLARVIRAGGFQVHIDRSFEDVIRACALAERDADDAGTWIDQEIFDSYCALHEAGYAHSVEAWHEGKLAGGLYGVALGGAFFGESMFHDITDASKVALVALVERLRNRGFTLLDTQWTTPHLEQFGAIEIPRARYLELLAEALELDCSFEA
ncbi:MAG TPA: leucyl/phenylalanyl-tRNA--protein transferase [Vicinamibacterales bacterium]|nr:leucyl/phenylalanyl-tRNA--protein transferase [Vicinamibacterales bacterium]